LGQFQDFYARSDTWSLGICNGCQLMALLGWVPATGASWVQEPGAAALGALPDRQQPRFVHNESGRFESRFVTVKVRHVTKFSLLSFFTKFPVFAWY
jgi:phosphoribosylformylglycinamidine synthase